MADAATPDSTAQPPVAFAMPSASCVVVAVPNASPSPPVSLPSTSPVVVLVPSSSPVMVVMPSPSEAGAGVTDRRVSAGASRTKEHVITLASNNGGAQQDVPAAGAAGDCEQLFVCDLSKLLHNVEAKLRRLDAPPSHTCGLPGGEAADSRSCMDNHTVLSRQLQHSTQQEYPGVKGRTVPTAPLQAKLEAKKPTARRVRAHRDALMEESRRLTTAQQDALTEQWRQSMAWGPQGRRAACADKTSPADVLRPLMQSSKAANARRQRQWERQQVQSRMDAARAQREQSKERVMMSKVECERRGRAAKLAMKVGLGAFGYPITPQPHNPTTPQPHNPSVA